MLAQALCKLTLTRPITALVMIRLTLVENDKLHLALIRRRSIRLRWRLQL